MISEFEKTDIDFEFIEAIDGEEFNKDKPECLSNGQYGCILSHKKALEEAKNHEHSLIAEDDIVLCADIKERLQIFINTVSDDWMMLYLGYFPSQYHPEPVKISNYIYRMNGQVGAFAYIVKGSFCQTLINELSDTKLPTDFVYAGIQKKYPCYCFIPFLVYVRESYSDIGKNIVFHEGIKEMYAERL